MQVVINHVTRMSSPRICVAGVDRATSEHVRPTTGRSDPITRDLLRENGGPFGMGALVDLGSVTAEPSPPETEDRRFCKEIRKHVVENVSRRLRRGVGAFLMLGLARPYQARNDDRARHWLQLNGLCLVDKPTADTP